MTLYEYLRNENNEMVCKFCEISFVVATPAIHQHLCGFAAAVWRTGGQTSSTLVANKPPPSFPPSTSSPPSPSHRFQNRILFFQ
jgi:hypothetical protein